VLLRFTDKLFLTFLYNKLAESRCVLKRTLGVACLFLLLISPLNAAPDPIPPPYEMIVEPDGGITNRWVLVMDTSHSMRGVFAQTMKAYLEITEFPTDELFFSLVTFNNRGMEQFKDWVGASEDEFTKASDLIEKEARRGVLSYGATALRMALRQERDELTIIVITDGGFTEACEGREFGSIRRVLEENQQWRIDQGFGEAKICFIGIENKGYTTGGKPTDEQCQAFFREIGTRWKGGYFLVRQSPRRRVG